MHDSLYDFIGTALNFPIVTFSLILFSYYLTKFELILDPTNTYLYPLLIRFFSVFNNVCLSSLILVDLDETKAA